MKQALTFLLIISTLVVNAQSRRTKRKPLPSTPTTKPALVSPDDIKCRFSYFKGTRQISTSICKIADHPLRGAATAYDRRGNIIYQRETRRYGGHASVDFTYHANGAVHTVYYSSAPDAGIQWYNSTHYFDLEGKLVDVKSQSHEDMISVRLDTNKALSNPAVNPRYEVMKCAEIWVTSVWIKNTLSDTLRAEHRFTGMREPSLVTLVPPGSEVKITDLVDAERFANVRERMELLVFNQRSKSRIAFSDKKSEEAILSRTEKRITFLFQ
jgi:hypothetical protein